MRRVKAVISYKFTGEPIKKVEELLECVCDAMRQSGIEPFCIQFSKKGEDTDEEPSVMMRRAFDRIDATDMLFVVQSSEAKSEGMLMEVGYAIAKGIPVVVATHVGIKNTYLPDMADQTIRYSDLEDLSRKISGINALEPVLNFG